MGIAISGLAASQLSVFSLQPLANLLAKNQPLPIPKLLHELAESVSQLKYRNLFEGEVVMNSLKSGDESPNPLGWGKPRKQTETECCLNHALEYLDRGFSVIPICPESKIPPIQWKKYQNCKPTAEELRNWWREWPDAGVAVVLGPVSGLFVIDVDGTEGHEVFLKYLGEIPTAPKVLSGSRQPNRYHLFFNHPEFDTKARATPWHNNLEFRGNKGIVVLPPSTHKSGHCYTWAEGKSLDDLPMPELPAKVIAALRENSRTKNFSSPRDLVRPPRRRNWNLQTGITKNTREFLLGHYASQSGWNNRLFNAACDLCGNGVSIKKALPLLIRGARPRSEEDEKDARRTIESAYSELRQPARNMVSNLGRGGVQ
jgi:hypothetical protein